MSMSRMLLVVGAVAAVGMVAVAAGCSDESNPFVNNGDGSPGTDDPVDGGPGDVDARPPTADAGPLRACATTPTRVVVLGDSITACSVVGGENHADCVSKKFFDHVKSNYAPSATYENVAVGGAQTSGLMQQYTQVAGGAGHVLVMVYMGGNDLAPYIFQSDAAAMSAFESIVDGVVADWQELFAYFDDATRFPGGVTIVMNNQYNPFDDCTASPYNLSQLKTNLLHMFNAILVDLANEHFANTILVDQYTPYLGHGHHYSVTTCPHYAPGQTAFMKDLIHANPAGNTALAAELNRGADRLYEECKR